MPLVKLKLLQNNTILAGRTLRQLRRQPIVDIQIITRTLFEPISVDCLVNASPNTS
jgi:hypothetical protein